MANNTKRELIGTTTLWRFLVVARHLLHTMRTRLQLLSQTEIRTVTWPLPYSNIISIIPYKSLKLSSGKITSVWPHLIQQSWVMKINNNSIKMDPMKTNLHLQVKWTLSQPLTRELWMPVQGTWMVRQRFLPRRLRWCLLSDFVIEQLRIHFQYIYHWRNNIMG